MYKKIAAIAAAVGAFSTGTAMLLPVSAYADEVFAVCPGGHAGIATTVTSCPFAQNVRSAYLNQVGPVVVAYSPVTGMSYTMQCQPGFVASLNNGSTVNAVRCVGGDNAVVILF